MGIPTNLVAWEGSHLFQVEEFGSLVSRMPTNAPASHVEHIWSMRKALGWLVHARKGIYMLVPIQRLLSQRQPKNWSQPGLNVVLAE